MKLRKIINIELGTELIFEFVEESAENQKLQEKLSHYHIIVEGSGVFIYSRANSKLISHFKSFDNTQLILDSDGYSIAAEFGAKRFPIGLARQAMDAESALQVKAIQFKRDLRFPLKTNDAELKHTYRVADPEQLLQTRAKYKATLYEELAELFNRCSDYTPAKKQEFLQGGALADKYCRFNAHNLKPRSGVVTVNTFLLDEKNKIMGTQSATIVVQPNKEVDIYLYDEVVDYFALMTPDQITEYTQLSVGKDELSDADKETPIAKLVESKRVELLAPLFAAMRLQLLRKITELLPELDEQTIAKMIDEGKIRAMIRAAAVWYPSSALLHCEPAQPGVLVIHGQRTALGNALDEQIKEWATRQIKELSVSNQFTFSSPDRKGLKSSLEELSPGSLSPNTSDERKAFQAESSIHGKGF